MDYQDILDWVKSLISEKRFKHTIGVVETAVKLAQLYGVNKEQARVAAVLHDAARGLAGSSLLEKCREFGIEADEVETALPDLLHGKLAACQAEQKFGIRDQEVLQAIKYHTTGYKTMSTLDKIIFIADMIEPGREFPDVLKLRELAFTDLNEAVRAGLESTIRHVLDKGLVIHPTSIEARNSLLKPST